jgi:glycosyltransferase involved in cell wall biosynthesis
MPHVWAQKPNVVHFHWLHPYFSGRTPAHSIVALLVFLIQWPMLRFTRTKIIWTVHNIRNHEGKMAAAESFVQGLVGRHASAIIVHCAEAAAQLRQSYPAIPPEKVREISHGNYIGVYPEGIGRHQAREQLDLPADACVALFFGEIRAYKGIDELLTVYEGPTAPEDTLLMIAGRVHDDQLRARLEAAARNNTNIRLRLGFVPENEVQVLMAAADVVVAPFRQVLTSGSVLLALSFGKPVVAPLSGCLRELADKAKGFFYRPEDPNGLGESLRRLRRYREALAEMGHTNRLVAASLNWESIAASTAALYSGAGIDHNSDQNPVVR